MASAHKAAGDAHAHHDGGDVHAHISPFGFMVAIFGALIVLTVVTVGASYFDFGSANLIVAILVATTKASLVATFFMHLKYDKAFNATIFVMSFVFLGLLLYFTSLDIGTRGTYDPDNGAVVLPKNGFAAPGGFTTDEDMVGAPHGAAEHH